MIESGLPEDVRVFIREHVTSIDKMEILLYLYESSPRMQTASAIAEALHVSAESVARRLTVFYDKGLIAASEDDPPLYWFESRGSLTGKSLNKLAALYKERRVSVVNEIFSNPISTIQTFADAFIFGRRKE